MKKFITIAILLISFRVTPQVVPVHIVEVIPEILCQGDSIDVKFVFTQTISPTMNFLIEVELMHGSITWIDTVFTGCVGSLISIDTLTTGERIYESKQKIPSFTSPGQWSVTANIQAPDFVYITVNQCANFPQIITYGPGGICPGDTLCMTIYDPTQQPFYFNIETQSTNQPNILWWTEVQWDTLQGDTMKACIITPNYLPAGPAMIGVNLVSLAPFTILDCGQGLSEYKLNQAHPTYYNLYGEKTDPTPNTLLIEQIGNNRRKVIIQQ